MGPNIGLDAAKAQEVAAGLTTLLADTYALYLKTQGFHWNVRGPMFEVLHPSFEAQYRELAEAVDVVAERVRALGFSVPATFDHFAKQTNIPPVERVPSTIDMVRDLARDHETIIRNTRTLVGVAQAAHDEATADMLIDRLRAHEERAWMLRSTLEG